jgi:hypothetical protein
MSIALNGPDILLGDVPDFIEGAQQLLLRGAADFLE